MNAKQMLFSAAVIYLFTAVLTAANPAGPAWFEAHTSGARMLTLRGAAEFGPVPGDDGATRYVLTLGGNAPAGAVIFTWADGGRPEPGVYDVSESSSAFIRALIVTGPPTQPTGAFRARAGNLTITRASGDVIEGTFGLEAVGFEASDAKNEDQRLMVRGNFQAKSSAR